VVEIRGLDVYDPTTGALPSSSVDDIAAWFLDTDYDGDAFFVCRAYFTGADDPYDRLRKTLKADLRRSLCDRELHSQPPLPPPQVRQDSRQGQQPLRRRNHEGARDRS
jgi:adenine-specific DNA-methyltransferase